MFRLGKGLKPRSSSCAAIAGRYGCAPVCREERERVVYWLLLILQQYYCSERVFRFISLYSLALGEPKQMR
jgi:hypothetical protein